MANGSKQGDITLGLKWYVNPNTKLTFNYIQALIDHDLYDGNLDLPNESTYRFLAPTERAYDTT